MMVNNFNILIIGGSDLLGRNLALHFAPMAANIFLLARKAHDLETVCSDLKSDCKADFAVCDLANNSQLIESSEKIMSFFTTIDIIFNVAGGAYVGRTNECPDEEFNYMIDAYIRGQSLLIKKIIPLIRRSTKTTLINFLTDWLTRQSGMESGNALYTMTKAAMQAFSERLASEEHQNGLQISNLFLGQIADTNQSVETFVDEAGNVDILSMTDICTFVENYLRFTSLHVSEATLTTKSPSYARHFLHTNSPDWDLPKQ